MAGIKVTDIAYGRLKAPDLDLMEEFLTRFGMVRADRTSTALYMRGTDPAHHIHITEKGEPKVTEAPVSRLVAVTVAPGRTAPLSSLTCPMMLAAVS